MCEAKHNGKHSDIVDIINGVIGNIEDIVAPDDDDTTETDENQPDESPEIDEKESNESPEVDPDKMPPEPENIKLQYVLYAINSKVILYHCTDVSKKKSLYKKKLKLLIYIRGIKQKTGTKLPWNKVAKINREKRNFINMAYVKGKNKIVPVKSAAIKLMYFLKCLKKEGANVRDITIRGGRAAKKIFKFYKNHKHWIKK